MSAEAIFTLSSLGLKGTRSRWWESDLKLCNLLVAPIDGESEIGIKLLGEFGVLVGRNGLRSVTGLGCMGFS
jgi:hypothetical protein